MTEAEHLDSVEMRLARKEDELRRCRLLLVRIRSLTDNALTAIYTSDLPSAAYDLTLARSLGRGEELEE